ncbi:hypothetical protein SAMN04487926_13813, partial [Paraburkholderia steynii]
MKLARLRARDAAVGFCRRHARRRWCGRNQAPRTPVVLRWHRWRAERGGYASPRRAAPTLASWVTHVHLHISSFHVSANAPGARGRERVSARVAADVAVNSSATTRGIQRADTSRSSPLAGAILPYRAVRLNGSRTAMARNAAASIAHTTKHVSQMVIGRRIDREAAQHNASSRADRIASRADSLVSYPFTRTSAGTRIRISSTRMFALANRPAPSMHARGPASGPAARDAHDRMGPLARGERGVRVSPVRRSPMSSSNTPGIGARSSARAQASDSGGRPSLSDAPAQRFHFATDSESFNSTYGLKQRAPLLRGPVQTPYSNAKRQVRHISVAPSVLAYMGHARPVELQWRTHADRRPNPGAAETGV